MNYLITIQDTNKSNISHEFEINGNSPSDALGKLYDKKIPDPDENLEAKNAKPTKIKIPIGRFRIIKFMRKPPNQIIINNQFGATDGGTVRYGEMEGRIL